jgi:type IV secretory pathway VirB10-like protein
MARLLLFTALCLFAASLAAGKMYRWVDADGVTHYTQSPPPKGEATEIRKPPPPAISPEEAQRQLAERQQRLEDAREDRELAKKKDQETTETQQLQDKNCQAARNNLTRLEGSPRSRWKGEDGEYQRYSEEERQAKIQEAREQIKAFCK